MSARTNTTTRSEARGQAATPDPRPAAARAEVYRFLAQVFADPRPGGMAMLRRDWPATEAALARLGLEAPDCAGLLALDDAGLRRAHLAVFGHAMSKDCPPYGAEYGQAHIFEKTQTLADVAGFYRAFGLGLSGDVRDRPDHLALELEFMEFLCLKQALAEAPPGSPERETLCRDAQRAFLEAHLGVWAFSFAHRLCRRTGTGPFAECARLLERFLDRELAAMGIERRADPFVNDGSVDRVEDDACGACPAMAADGSAEGRMRP